MNRLRRIVRRLSMAENGESHNNGSGDSQHREDTSASSSRNFDLTLPSRHTYLGDLREVSSTPYYPEGDLVLLPVVHIPDVVLMPHQQIPINVEPYELDLNPILNDLLDVEHQRKGFVCMAAQTGHDEHFLSMHPYYYFGTIASVVRIENSDVQHGEDEGIRMIVKGCQRCYLKKSVVEGGAIYQKHYGWFRILPVCTMPNPLAQATPNEWKTALASVNCRSFGAYCTSLMPPVFSTLEVNSLVEAITAEIKTWQMTDGYPQDPLDFSYFVASNLPVSAQTRLQLLGAVSTAHRLRACLKMLRAYNQLDCFDCHTMVAAKEDGICMTREGLTTAYMNPGGLTQEIFTVKKVSPNIYFHGKPTLEFTWFPGYTWRHAACGTCHSHLGWRYDAVRKDMHPQQFFGLQREEVLPSINPTTQMNPEERLRYIEEQMMEMMPITYREL
ncbi:protein cereblon-like [Paramacrobiotus metropolitanus]|uniref:protein cereblon-like n=1 Tax=Paramacrobiotus metropolitanus TaxID=2943436 RepID=UPI002445E119|nr:protein cereblon-like [Paramacrobiotus metropolitanus]